MGKVTCFEDLMIWKESVNLCASIYILMKYCKDYGFKDQIQRAAVSISSNIAEGFERQTNKEFIQYLYIARGSCGEVRSQLHIAHKLGYIKDNELQILVNKAKLLSSTIFNLIQTRKKCF